MTTAEFLAQHDDSTTWTTADIEEQQNLASIAALDTQPQPATPAN